MGYLEERFGKQTELSLLEDVSYAIDKAISLSDMNKLRVSTVKFMNKKLLKKWQDKYWSMKKCPACGKLK